MPKGYKGKVGYKTGGVFDKNTNSSFEQQTDAWKKEADCGCGIDCCNKELVLSEKTSNAAGAIFFDGGALYFRNGAGAVFAVTLTPVE